MSKLKVTSKWLKANYNCINISYCELQSILRFRLPQFYHCGVYGWNYDVYTLEDLKDYAICTGYRAMPCNVKLSKDKFNIVQSYELKAKKLLSERLTYDELKTHMDNLLVELLTKLIVK